MVDFKALSQNLRLSLLLRMRAYFCLQSSLTEINIPIFSLPLCHMSRNKMFDEMEKRSCISCVLDSGGSQPAFTSSKLTIETLEQGVKYVQS